MSARRAYVDGRPVWIPVDDGVTAWSGRIGGSLVTERPIPVGLNGIHQPRHRTAAYRAMQAEASRRYRQRRKGTHAD